MITISRSNGFEIRGTSVNPDIVNVNAVPVVDTTLPIITLVGTGTVNLFVGDTYTDSGATAADDTDGDITASIVTVNPVNTSASGTKCKP